jgi:hypothetical protein
LVDILKTKERKNKGELMQALIKKLPILVLASSLLVSCGKGENSSGSSSTSNLNGLPGNSYSQASAYTSLDQVRSAFNAKALSDGLQDGTEVFHVGPYFNSSYGGSSLSFNAGFCIQLFNWSAGDCQNQSNSMQTYLMNQLDNGKYKKVSGLNTNSLSFKEPSGVSNTNGFWQYQYNNPSIAYDRNSNAYKAMLGLDIPAQNIIASHVSAATITMSNGQTIQGQILEIVIGYNSWGQPSVSDIKRFVLSTNLPTFANPIAVINGMNPVVQGYQGQTALVNGYLAYLGNSSQQGQALAVQRIQISKLNVSYWGQLQAVQNITIGFGQ